MKSIKTTLLALTVLLSANAEAQQMPQSNLYNFNQFGINPAYAGIDGCTEGYLSHLNQWVSLPGAPSTNYLGVHTSLGDHIGIGANFVMDNTNMIQRLSGSGAFAYGIKLSADHNLRFGISAGFYQVQIDPSDVIADDLTDEVISGGTQVGTTFDSKFGVFYTFKGLQVGLSVPQVFETRANFDFANLDGFGISRTYVGYAAYKHDFNAKWAVKPSVMYKFIDAGASQVDVNALIVFNNMITVGVGYRSHVGLLAQFGLVIKDVATVAYAYELPGSNISSYSTGSHQIMLGIRICKDKKTSVSSLGTGTEAAVVNPEPDVTPVPVVVPEPDVEPEPTVIPEPIATPDPVAVPEPVVVAPVLEKEVFNLVLSFENGSTSVEGSAKSGLDKMAEQLKANPDVKLEIIGHSCSDGSETTKRTVAIKRAKDVEDYLVSKGVPANRITVTGKSDKDPEDSADTEVAKAKNRRVEFVIK